MKLFLLFSLIISSSLAAPTLEHILGLKQAVRDYYNGGGHNYAHGRDYGQPYVSGYGGAPSKNDNSQVVYIQNGQTQQNALNSLGGAGPYPHIPQRPHFVSTQSTANAISNGWSNHGADYPVFSGNGGGAGASAQSSSSAWSSSGSPGYM